MQQPTLEELTGTATVNGEQWVETSTAGMLVGPRGVDDVLDPDAPLPG